MSTYCPLISKKHIISKQRTNFYIQITPHPMAISLPDVQIQLELGYKFMKISILYNLINGRIITYMSVTI